MDIRKIFGENVRKYRLKNGYTQEELAELANIGEKLISPIENGRSFIKLDNIPKLCEVLRVEPFQLFLTNTVSTKISEAELRERVFARLDTCKREELNLLCDILTRFIER